jgi:pimeloyl-ACP methyl ester carboxylesterase
VAAHEHTIELDEMPAFFRRAPAAGAERLYLHALPTSSDDMVPFLERGGGIAPDLPGFGRTTKAGQLPYSPDSHADFIERLLDELDIHSFKLIAHGWGAGGGLVFAQRHPERIEKLVLIDPLPLLPGFHWHRLARMWRTPLLGELTMGSIPRWYLRRMLRHAGTNPDSWSRAEVKVVWDFFDQGTQRAVLRLHRSANPDDLADAGAQLENVTAPALLIWGEHDPWFPSRFADEYGQRLPDARLWKLEDAGHWPWLDHPDVVGAVDAFLGDD